MNVLRQKCDVIISCCSSLLTPSSSCGADYSYFYHHYSYSGIRRGITCRAASIDSLQRAYWSIIKCYNPPDCPTAVGVKFTYLWCKSTHFISFVKSSVIFLLSCTAIGLILPCFNFREGPCAAGKKSKGFESRLWHYDVKSLQWFQHYHRNFQYWLFVA